MLNNFPISKDDLYNFISDPGEGSYANKPIYEANPERPEFFELVTKKGDLTYRDSYIGHFRSRGMEVVRFKDKPIWASNYGGGMTDGHYDLANETFDFLKKAFVQKDKSFQSMRGPSELKEGDWLYTYKQAGNVEEFSGTEEIYHKGVLVFYHKISGGIIE